MPPFRSRVAPGDEAVEFPGEEDRRPGDIVRMAGAPQGNGGDGGADVLGRRVDLVELRAEDQSGGNGIGADAGWAEFQRQGPGKGEDGAFGRRVGERAGIAALGRRATKG